jgi:hypothetical protein
MSTKTKTAPEVIDPMAIDPIEIEADPLLSIIRTKSRLADAARDVLQYSDPDGELMAELAAALKDSDAVEAYFDRLIAANKAAAAMEAKALETEGA